MVSSRLVLSFGFGRADVVSNASTSQRRTATQGIKRNSLQSRPTCSRASAHRLQPAADRGTDVSRLRRRSRGRGLPQRRDRRVSDRELPHARAARRAGSRASNGSLQRHSDATGKAAAPICPNLIVHRSNARLQTICGFAAAQARDRHHQRRLAGGGVWRRCMMPARWCSPMSPAIRHAERAVEAGADGLVLLTAGAGGQTGWLNPFVFVRAVRALLRRADRARGRHQRRPRACARREALGCDLAYMGTKFIATHESMADASATRRCWSRAAPTIFC